MERHRGVDCRRAWPCLVVAQASLPGVRRKRKGQAVTPVWLILKARAFGSFSVSVVA